MNLQVAQKLVYKDQRSSVPLRWVDGWTGVYVWYPCVCVGGGGVKNVVFCSFGGQAPGRGLPLYVRV